MQRENVLFIKEKKKDEPEFSLEMVFLSHQTFVKFFWFPLTEIKINHNVLSERN